MCYQYLPTNIKNLKYFSHSFVSINVNNKLNTLRYIFFSFFSFLEEKRPSILTNTVSYVKSSELIEIAG